MKENNKGNGLKKMLIILLIVLLSVISFVGIYVKDGNEMKNLIPNYIVGSDLEGYRVLRINLDDSTNEIIKNSSGDTIEDITKETATDSEGNSVSLTKENMGEYGYTTENEPVNKEEDKNRDNYLLARKIIIKRLTDLQVSDYKVRQDLEDGTITLEIKEDSRTDNIISNIVSQGTFEIQNDETKEVLLKNTDIAGTQVLYNTATAGTTIYLSIEFSKDGAQKLEEISKEYIKTTDSDGNETEKKVNLLINGESLITTSFSSPITNGKLQLSIGNGEVSTDKDTLNTYVSQAQNMSVILKNGKLPLKYKTESNRYIQSPDNKEMIKIVAIIAVSVLAIMMLVLIIRFKLNGIIAVLTHIGYNAILLLLVRYANVEIGIGGLIAFGLIQIINYILLTMIIKGEVKKKEIIKFIYRIIPTYIIAIVFAFMSFLPIYSFGMVMFWAISISLIYNTIVTKKLIER